MIYILLLVPALYYFWPKRLTGILSVLFRRLSPVQLLDNFDGVKLGIIPSIEDEERDCFKYKRTFYIIAQGRVQSVYSVYIKATDKWLEIKLFYEKKKELNLSRRVNVCCNKNNWDA